VGSDLDHGREDLSTTTDHRPLTANRRPPTTTPSSTTDHFRRPTAQPLTISSKTNAVATNHCPPWTTTPSKTSIAASQLSSGS
jgi:hypothetical protein